MLCLALDTSGPLPSVALTDEAGALVLQVSSGPAAGKKRAGRDVLAWADEALRACGATRRDIALLGVARGPGSFTGVRIGVSTALGIALGLQVPAYGVSTLEAMAIAARALVPDERLLPVAFIAAGRDRIYLGYRKMRDGAPFLEEAIARRSLARKLPRRARLLLAGEAAFALAEGRGSVALHGLPPLAHAVARAALAARAAGGAGDVADLRAVYLRPSGALTPAMRARRSGRVRAVAP